MKKFKLIVGLLSLLSVAACSDSEQSSKPENQFDADVTAEVVRNKVVVISDIHLGADLSYSEFVAHSSRLVEFIHEARSSQSVKELVIAGDFFDEWYVPSRNNTYGTGDQNAFIRKIAATNKPIFDALRELINEQIVRVTYVHGNHDLLVPEQIISEVLPGIHIVQDSERQGLGTYYTETYPMVAIEHSHRYDFFCAPDPFSNQEIASGTILPAGYFFTRVAVNSVLDYPKKGEETPVPTTVLNYPEEISQQHKFTYYKVWKRAFEQEIPTKERFDEKIITTNINHLKGTFSINDFLPYNAPDGSITMKLYAESCSQESWEQRLKYNHVPIMTKVDEAIVGSLITTFLDNQSDVQYFGNKQSNARVVVFGHTHIPKLVAYQNYKNEGCIYANSGTWIDRKEKQQEKYDQDVENMDFVVISRPKTPENGLKVELKKLAKGKHLLIDSQTISL